MDVRRWGGEEREKLSVRLPPVGTGETARVMWIVQTMDLLQPYTPLSLSSSASKHCALPPFPSNFSPLLPHPHPSPLPPTHRVTLKFAFSGPAQQSVQPLPRSLPPSESTNYFLGHPQPLSSLLLSLSRVLPLSCSFFFVDTEKDEKTDRHFPFVNRKFLWVHTVDTVCRGR